MKLVIAIIGNEDAAKVLENLTKSGFSVTRLSTTGEFLKTGNTTLLLGVREEKVQDAIDIIGQYSSKRSVQDAPVPLEEEEKGSMENNPLLAKPIQVAVGGAVVFVLDVEQFHKL